MARFLLVLACVFGCLTFSHCQSRFGIVPGATMAPSTGYPSPTTVSTSAPTQSSAETSTYSPPTTPSSSSTAAPTTTTATPSSTPAPYQASTTTSAPSSTSAPYKASTTPSTATSTTTSTSTSTSAPYQKSTATTTSATTPAPTAAPSTYAPKAGATDAPTGSTTQSSTIPSTAAQSADSPVEYVGQFESALTESQQSYRMNRSNAQENQTLHLNSATASQAEFRMTICAKPLYAGPVMFRPGTFHYTNDGPSDTITLVLNEEIQVTATTLANSQGGKGWNQPMSFDFPETFTPLDAGNHSVRVLVKTDQWGVDLDALSFIAKNQNRDVMLLCDARLVEY